jgi:hypothetical protein
MMGTITMMNETNVADFAGFALVRQNLRSQNGVNPGLSPSLELTECRIAARHEATHGVRRRAPALG